MRAEHARVPQLEPANKRALRNIKSSLKAFSSYGCIAAARLSRLALRFIKILAKR